LVADRFPEALQSVYALNPMVGVLEAFRWAVLGTAWPGLGLVAIPIVESLVLVITGLVYYERAQRTFADIV
jgi:lipopolysaccharide transport system permease protein